MANAAGDISVIRFPLEMDPDDATLQDSTRVIAVTGAVQGANPEKGFLFAKFALPIEFAVIDTGVGKGTKRKFVIMAIGSRTIN